MLYRKVKKTGDQLSILGFGCMRFQGAFGNIEEKRAERQVKYAIDQGLNYLDTAYFYQNGQSELFLGKILTDGYRERVKIATKLPHWATETKEEFFKMFELQLKRLQTDCIDYYLIHNITGHSWQKLKERGVIDFLEQIKKSGRILNSGFSYHGDRQSFAGVVDDYDWDICQIQYNILDENNQAGKQGLEYAAEKGMGVIIMGPLRGGSLVKTIPPAVQKLWQESPVQKSPTEWLLRWIWNHPQVTVVLSGMGYDEHIMENLKIASQAEPDSLDTRALEMIEKVRDVYQSIMRVGCTNCRYCIPCPAGVDIPSCFEYYNNYFMFGKKLAVRIMYLVTNSTLLHGKSQLAANCIGCGQCEKKCPQNIAIQHQLKKVSRALEGPFLSTKINIVIFLFNLKKKITFILLKLRKK